MTPRYHLLSSEAVPSMLLCPGLAQWYAMQEQTLPPSFAQRIRRLSDASTLPRPMHEVYAFYTPD